MKGNNELINYIHTQRWCGFKQEIADGRVTDVDLDAIPFDNGNKFFTLGTAKFDDGTEKKFFMPLAKGHMDGVESVTINGQEYFDAMKTPDYWKSLMNFFKENHNAVTFNNGAVVKYHTIGEKEIVQDNLASSSKPLNVEQSNTTIRVGDDIAFKQDRMIESDYGVSVEVEMNAKLMETGCSAMPKTYGAFIMEEPNGEIATLGIVQEFVPNRGDLWSYANNYLVNALNEAQANGQDKIDVNDHKDFIEMMRDLGRKTAEMSECLARSNGNPDFEPIPVDEAYLYKYEKSLSVLLFQTEKTIEQNLQNLDGATKKQAEDLLQNWDNLTHNFVQAQVKKINNGEAQSNIVRVHGDFHLGQVLVTKNNDLKFLDFAGEPGLSVKERKVKYPETRDFAGMYRSISGYLGPVVAETFAATGEIVKRANGTEKKVTNPEQEAWANQAVVPMIEAATQAFLNGRSEREPMLALEILRKNLYEVKYEVGNRPDMAHIPVKGLVGLLKQGNEMENVHANVVAQKQVNVADLVHAVWLSKTGRGM